MSRIEQLIGEIEEYIDSCKFQPLSTTKILVNKEELEELLVEDVYKRQAFLPTIWVRWWIWFRPILNSRK